MFALLAAAVVGVVTLAIVAAIAFLHTEHGNPALLFERMTPLIEADNKTATLVGGRPVYWPFLYPASIILTPVEVWVGKRLWITRDGVRIYCFWLTLNCMECTSVGVRPVKTT